MKFGLREACFVLLLLAIMAGSWWFVFRPQNARNIEVQQQTQAKRAKLQSLNRATASLSDLKQEIQEYNNAIAFFQSKLPAEKEIDKVLGEISNLVKANDLVATSIRTLKRTNRMVEVTSDSSPYAEQPISLQLQGNFKGFYSFLLSLEAQPRIIRIYQMRMEKLPKVGEGVVKATLTMSIFYERNSVKE